MQCSRPAAGPAGSDQGSRPGRETRTGRLRLSERDGVPCATGAQRPGQGYSAVSAKPVATRRPTAGPAGSDQGLSASSRPGCAGSCRAPSQAQLGAGSRSTGLAGALGGANRGSTWR